MDLSSFSSTGSISTSSGTVASSVSGMELRFHDLSVAGRLSDVSGELRTGSLTLLLGRPGSGKSALLQALAGRAGVAMSGEVRYNGVLLGHQLVPHFVALVGQRDDHHAEITVRETLGFARQCCALDSETEGEDDSETMLRELGLEHCADSLVEMNCAEGSLEARGSALRSVKCSKAAIDRCYCSMR